MPRSSLAVPVLCFTASACFPTPDAEASASPVALALHDLGGVTASADDAPRDLELSLTFSGPVPADDVLLLRGAVEASLLEQLSDASLRELEVPLTTRRDARVLWAQPVGALTPGRYSVVWNASVPRCYPLLVSASPTLGARLVETWPGAGASQVPANLSRALLRFDGHVRGALADAVTLRDSAGKVVPARVSVERCSALGFPEGDCAWVAPEPLLPGGAYVLALAAGLHTPGGAEVQPVEVPFEVAASDHTPAALRQTSCALDERALGGACLRADDRELFLRGAVSEPALVSLQVGDQRAAVLSYAGELALALAPQPRAGSATVRLIDLAGNVSELALPFALLDDLPHLTLDELRPDPRGKEPAQEYIELLNSGPEPVSLKGYSLTKDALSRGRELSAAESLAPGERALLVGPEFDPRALEDGALPSAARLLPLSGALSLANAGEPLWLRDARGRRVASARALAPLIEGQCTRRVGAAVRQPHYELDARGGCTPGAPSDPP